MINVKLEQKNENVSAIKYIYGFDTSEFKKTLFEEFNQIFRDYHKSGTSWDSVQQVLFLIEPNESLFNMPYDDFMREMQEKIDQNGFRRVNNYVAIILEIFSGVFCVAGIIELFTTSDTMVGYYGAVLSCITLIFLLFGQRIAKDYDGARTIVIYFVPAIFAVFLLS